MTENGVKLVEIFESFRSKPYICPAGYLTVGFGHVIKEGESFTELTITEARHLLLTDLESYEKKVLKMTKVMLTYNQLDALVSLVYNIGTGAYQRSTLRMKLNRGEIEAASLEILRWNKIKGVPSKGLTLRRQLEFKLFNS